jgi:subtilisin family serine protease
MNFVDADEAQFRRDRHGTEVAGVIAAVANNHEGIVGVAPSARLMVFKACWQAQADADAARCNSFTLARALAAAFDAHAQIVNLSLAGPDDPLLGDLIREGQRRGVLFVGAAAELPAIQNSVLGPQNGPMGLMQRPGIIQVASAESRSQTGGFQTAGSSQVGGFAQTGGSSQTGALYAPGNEILTLLPGGHYDFASGASIATAQVSGVVALLLAKNADLSATAAYRLLRDTSSGGADGNMGGVDACAAVVSLVGRGSCHIEHDPRIALH